MFKDIYSPVARLFRQSWYNPARVVAAGADEIRRTFRDLIDLEDDLHWVDHLVKLAAEVLPLYASTALDYDLLQAEVSREQRQLADLEERADTVWRATVHPAYL